jgi:hypothetical protein
MLAGDPPQPPPDPAASLARARARVRARREHARAPRASSIRTEPRACSRADAAAQVRSLASRRGRSGELKREALLKLRRALPRQHHLRTVFVAPSGLAEHLLYADSHFISHVPFLAPPRAEDGLPRRHEGARVRRDGYLQGAGAETSARQRAAPARQGPANITSLDGRQESSASSGRCGARARSDEEAGVDRAFAVPQCACVRACVCVCARVGQNNRCSLPPSLRESASIDISASQRGARLTCSGRARAPG